MQHLKKIKIILGSVILFLVIFSGMAEAVEIAEHICFIVNNENPKQEIISRDLRKIFLGKKTFWNENARITLLLQEENIPEFYEFIDYQKREFEKYWLRRALSGSHSPLKYVQSDYEALRFVGSNKGAISYISKNTDVSAFDVKIIKIVP